MAYALVFVVGAIIAWLLAYAWHRSLEDKRKTEEERRRRQEELRSKRPKKIAFVVCVLDDGTERSVGITDVVWSEAKNGQLLVLAMTAEYTWAPGRWVECTVREVTEEEA